MSETAINLCIYRDIYHSLFADQKNFHVHFLIIIFHFYFLVVKSTIGIQIGDTLKMQVKAVRCNLFIKCINKTKYYINLT